MDDIDLELLTPSEEEFQELRALIYSRFGINLTEQKKTLVSGRLQKTLRDHGYDSFSEYLAFLKSDSTGRAIEDLANKISTNHTFFFRENEHFEFFVRQALPEAVERQKKTKDLRIWSAGCSSGEEAYTLIMLMMEALGHEYQSWKAGVLATDISNRVLDFARAGIYPEDRLQSLPEEIRRKYFRRAGEDQWAIDERVKSQATFRVLNLMNEKFPFQRQFDMIFCRNVMIYFDQETKDRLVDRMKSWIVPGGYFFIGHSESVRREGLQYLMPALYRRQSA